MNDNLKIICRIIPFMEPPQESLPDLPPGHDYTLEYKNPNYEIWAETIGGFLALTRDARFIKL